jgi:hypothetical protein
MVIDKRWRNADYMHERWPDETRLPSSPKENTSLVTIYTTPPKYSTSGYDTTHELQIALHSSYLRNNCNGISFTDVNGTVQTYGASSIPVEYKKLLISFHTTTIH